jgi:hypothetical protein
MAVPFSTQYLKSHPPQGYGPLVTAANEFSSQSIFLHISHSQEGNPEEDYSRE